MQRGSIPVVGVVSTLMAVFVRSVYGLFILAADIVFVVLFPQLVCVLYASRTTSGAAVVGYVTSVALRLAAGEPYLNLPALVPFPFYAGGQQTFPFRTFIALLSTLLILGVSRITCDRCRLPCRSAREPEGGRGRGRRAADGESSADLVVGNSTEMRSDVVFSNMGR